MGKGSRLKLEQTKKQLEEARLNLSELKKINLTSSKITFVAGISALLMHIKDCIELFNNNDINLLLVFAVMCVYIFITYLILRRKIFDKFLRTNKATELGELYTIISILLFVVENILYIFEIEFTSVIITIMLSILVLSGTIMILLKKEK